MISFYTKMWLKMCIAFISICCIVAAISLLPTLSEIARTGSKPENIKAAKLMYIVLLSANFVDHPRNSNVFLVPQELAEDRFQLTFADPDSYTGPEVLGWPPGKDRNMSTYINGDTMPSKIQSCPKKLKKARLLILLKSKTSNSDRRQANRETWIQDQFYREDITILNFVGLGKNATEQKSLMQENQQHCDLVQLNLVDSYTNVTLKSVGMLQYVMDNINLLDPDFVFWMDDDSYLNIPGLFDQLLTEQPGLADHYTITGYCYAGKNISRPDPRDKFIERSVSPTYMIGPAASDAVGSTPTATPTYPAYMSGAGYLLPRPTLACLLQESMRLPFFHHDDVFVSGMAAERCGFPRRHDARFHAYRKQLDDVKPTDILMHYMEGEDKRALRRFFSGTRANEGKP